MSEFGQAVVRRDVHIAPQVVFLDGLTGTGKTMMGPILSSFARMEVQRMEQIYEYACALRFLGRIEEDAAVSLIRMYTDLACYNAMIGRETNFRWKDLSGVLANPGGWRYIRRLFMPDGDSAIDRIRSTRPILQIHSHGILGISHPLFEALGDRLKVVEMVRHPLYLLEHWSSYIDRQGTDPRDFAIWVFHRGEYLHWYNAGWEDKFLAANKMDRVIYSIDYLTRLAEDTFLSLDEKYRHRVLTIPFERFVVDPWPYLRMVGEALDTTTTASTIRTLRKQKVPRRLTTEGRDSQVYRRYNWRPQSGNSTEAMELQKRWDLAAQEATDDGMEVLKRICGVYEKKYLPPINSSTECRASIGSDSA